VVDARLASRGWRMAVATAGMAGALWLAHLFLAPFLAQASLAGVLVLGGVCLLGLAVYGGLGAALGIVRPAELRAMLRRPAGVRSAGPDEQS
jgi:hypothetical protein